MSTRAGETRQRMVSSTRELLRQYGATGTTLDRVLSHSGAPRGSVYHHFPEGRVQLVQEAVDEAGALMRALIADLDGEDPVAAVDGFFAYWRGRLIEEQYRGGCPVVAVAVDTNDQAPQLTRKAGQVFMSWQDTFIDLFLRHGLSIERSRRLAALVICAEEGAVVLCRAQSSTDPLDSVATEIHEHLVTVFTRC